MNSIWQRTDNGWRLVDPAGFPDEATLHRLVEEAPQLVPLSGSPELVVLGREVAVGSGFIDLLAVEPSGRLAIVEIKLASNAEARRAVVAQILAYAAFLRGMTPEELEDILLPQLRAREVGGIAELVRSEDQSGAFDDDSFSAGLEQSLAEGLFRLILVLDSAPPELVRVVGYLESIAPDLVLDLVVVNAYAVDGSSIVIPQRVQPDAELVRPETGRGQPRLTLKPKGHWSDVDAFEAMIEDADEGARDGLRRAVTWARQLEHERLVRLRAYAGADGRGMTLLPYLLDDDAGLITIWNEKGQSYGLQLWRSVFERRAPSTIPAVERIIAPVELGQGRATKDFSAELFEALTLAYREAAGPRDPDVVASRP